MKIMIFAEKIADIALGAYIEFKINAYKFSESNTILYNVNIKFFIYYYIDFIL